MKRRTLPGILALLFTLALWAGGLCAPAFAENDFSLDKRAWVSAGSGSQKLAFEPKISGVYDLYAFCGSGDPTARWWPGAAAAGICSARRWRRESDMCWRFSSGGTARWNGCAT